MRGLLVTSVVVWSLLLTGFAVTPAAAQPAEGDVVATGHITVGIELIESIGYTIVSPNMAPPGEDPYAFRFDAGELVGLWLAPTVPDSDPDMHFLAITYLDDQGDAIDTSCAASATDHAVLQQPYGQAGLVPRCLVPPGTAEARVSALVGANLDVVVIVAPGPRPVSPDPSVLIVVHYDYSLGLFADAINAFFGADAGSDASTADVSARVGHVLVIDAEDHGGLGYDLRLRFRDADGGHVAAACAWDDSSTGPLEEPYGRYAQKQTCVVPAGAVQVRLMSYHGVDIDVTVRVLPTA